MPKPKKNATYQASSETVRKFFERALKLREEQHDLSTMISALNKEMADYGVHPGVLAFCRRVAELPDGKRGLVIALTRVYFDWLEEALDDPQLNIMDVIRQAREGEAKPHVRLMQEDAATTAA